MTLGQRIVDLEAAQQIEEAIHLNGRYCDDGPYNAERLLSLWDVSGTFQSDGEVYNGREEISRFYASLKATFSFHCFTNVAVECEEAGTRGAISCYGFEAIVIESSSVIGFFSHDVLALPVERSASWVVWRQRVNVLSEHQNGWSDGKHVIQQRPTTGAARECETEG